MLLNGIHNYYGWLRSVLQFPQSHFTWCLSVEVIFIIYYIIMKTNMRVYPLCFHLHHLFQRQQEETSLGFRPTVAWNCSFFVAISYRSSCGNIWCRWKKTVQDTWIKCKWKNSDEELNQSGLHACCNERMMQCSQVCFPMQRLTTSDSMTYKTSYNCCEQIRALTRKAAKPTMRWKSFRLWVQSSALCLQRQSEPTQTSQKGWKTLTSLVCICTKKTPSCPFSCTVTTKTLTAKKKKNTLSRNHCRGRSGGILYDLRSAPIQLEHYNSCLRSRYVLEYNLHHNPRNHFFLANRRDARDVG